MKKLILIFFSVISLCCVGQPYVPNDTITYKHTKQGDLRLFVFYPDNKNIDLQRPVVISFFGGGWVGGSPKQFYPECAYYASHGIVGISAEYRVMKKHHTTPFECVKDGKSAVRWVRIHAKELGIDSDKIVTGGGSAGGHVAACTGIIKGYEEEGEDLSVSSVPNAMILFNPVLNTTKDGYGADKLKGKETLISPNHHIGANIPPTLECHGTDDHTVPFANAVNFAKKMKDAGNICKLVPFKGFDHGFFNPVFIKSGNKNDINFNKCMKETIEFLSKYLTPKFRKEDL